MDAPAIVEAREFIRSFQNTARRIRGPLLAEIDLEARLVEVIVIHYYLLFLFITIINL